MKDKIIMDEILFQMKLEYKAAKELQRLGEPFTTNRFKALKLLIDFLEGTINLTSKQLHKYLLRTAPWASNLHLIRSIHEFETYRSEREHTSNS